MTNQKQVITKRKDVTKQVSVKYPKENPVFKKSHISTYYICWVGGRRGWVFVVGTYLSLSGRGRGWAFIRGWALIELNTVFKQWNIHFDKQT